MLKPLDLFAVDTCEVGVKSNRWLWLRWAKAFKQHAGEAFL
jgi:hypothetical protein